MKKVAAVSQKLFIGVKSSFTAFHVWEKAPDEVAFLRNCHRHVFNVVLRLQIPADALDRRLEFFMVQKELKSFLSQWEDQELSWSCEMFAKEIDNWAVSKYKLLGCKVKVMEDNENFAAYSIEVIEKQET